jgi:hypothetical protein
MIKYIIIENDPMQEFSIPCLKILSESDSIDQSKVLDGFSGLLVLDENVLYSFVFTDKTWKFFNKENSDRYNHIGSFPIAIDKFQVRLRAIKISNQQN